LRAGSSRYFAVVVAILPIIDLARIVAAHSGLEVADAFAKPFALPVCDRAPNKIMIISAIIRASGIPSGPMVVLLKRVDSDERILDLA